jgi:hypothetical protein
MAKNYCIPKDLVPQLKESIKKLADGNQIEALTKMSPERRVEFFKSVVKNTDEATELNKRFEKAVGQKKLDALRSWVRDNIDASYRKDETIFNMTRYKNLEEVDNFVNSRMELLAEQKLGIALTDEQVKEMSSLGQRFYDESKKLGDNLGKVGFEEQNIAWGKAYKALTDKRDELTPVNWWKAIVNNLGRATMLASIKTPFLNIESNLLNAFTEAIARRGSVGVLNKNKEVAKLSGEYQKFARKMFKETGVDFTRMINLDDTVAGMGKVVGEETSVIPNVRLQAYTDFVFNKTLSIPDVFFASKAFTDSLALRVTKLAGKDDKAAIKLFTDATNVNATGEAKVIRDLAIADARYATYTQDSISGKISEELRTVLNKAGGLGDILMPFVKTPANVAELSVEYAGFGFVKGTFTVGKSLMKDGQISREAMQEAMRGVTRAGVGMTGAYLLAQNFDPEHFIGVYDPKRRTIDQLANTTNNAILIGDRWVSVDYLGPLAAPFVAFMYAKKYANQGDSPTAGFVSGATSQYLASLPFVDGKSVFDGIDMLTDPANTGKIVRLGEDLVGNLGNTIASRLVPGIMYDIARAFDDVQRDTKQSQFVVETPLYDFNFDSFINKIPFIRTTLPIKHDTLGRIMLETTPIESMLFGARVRDAQTDKITLEILRLRESGHAPKVKDLRFMNSTNVDKLKAKLGEDRFIDAVNQYGKDVAKKYELQMRNPLYRRAKDEEKAKMLSDISDDMYNQLLKRNGI